GARRGYERDRLVETPTYRAFRGEPPDQGRTVYLVATAAGEVGADLDAAAAVMDLVPLDRMIQRLGRVNRRGSLAAPAEVAILHSPAALAKAINGKDGPAKAEALRRE